MLGRLQIGIEGEAVVGIEQNGAQVPVAVEIGDQQFEPSPRQGHFLRVVDRVIDDAAADVHGGMHVGVHPLNGMPVDEEGAQRESSREK